MFSEILDIASGHYTVLRRRKSSLLRIFRIHENRAMHKAQSLQQTVDTVRECSSSPCWMHEVDPGYLGYWSNEETVAFLKSLLERERIGTKAFADIHAADLRIADLILESELDQGSICILLQKEIVKRGAGVTAPRKHLTNGRDVKSSLEQAVASAISNQARLIQTIEEAVLNILDSELSSHLIKLLQLHRKQIEQLKNLLT